MKQETTEELISIIKPLFLKEATGHDWHHIERVYRMALHLSEKEGGNTKIIASAALLHDISDHKFNGGDFNLGGKKATEILSSLSYEEQEIKHISNIVSSVSFGGNKFISKELTLEGKIVQDADRLDALGAIGIARTFAYGGFAKQPIYNPDIPPQKHLSAEEYLNNKTHTINHFYEKLLLLKDKMNTFTAKQIALERHIYLESYLIQFFKEWNHI